MKTTIEWIKIKTRPLDEEEKEYYGEEIEYVYDCPMPEDGQEIFIATKNYIDMDVCSNDDYGIGLERHGDFEGIVAWAEMPKIDWSEEE